MFLPTISIAISLPISISANETLEGKLVQSGDGVNYIFKSVDKNFKIRTHGVYIPANIKESAVAYAKDHFFGENVKVFVKGKDKSGLIYAEIKFVWGDTLSESLLKVGLAKWDNVNAPRIRSYELAEKEARDLGLGIWNKESDNDPPVDSTTSNSLENTPRNSINRENLPPNQQFGSDITSAKYQHSLAEKELTRARLYGGRTDRFNASKNLANSLKFDLDAIKTRIKFGRLSIDMFRSLQSESIRIQTEISRQLEISFRDDLDYGVGIAKYDVAIAMSKNGMNSDRESSAAKKIFESIDSHNDEAIKAIRDIETRLSDLREKMGQ